MSTEIRPEDQRRSARRLVTRLLRVNDAASGILLGNLVNLSEHGFMLICKTPVEAGQAQWLVMELPEPVDGRRSVGLEASCVWCQKSSYSDDYGAGYEIRSISPDDRRRLLGLYGAL